MPVQPGKITKNGGPCPLCGYRSCMCYDPRAASPTPQSGPAQPTPPSQDEIDSDKDEYLDHLVERARGDWNRQSIGDLLREQAEQIKELRRRLREKETIESNPNHHVYRGPPRS